MTGSLSRQASVEAFSDRRQLLFRFEVVIRGLRSLVQVLGGRDTVHYAKQPTGKHGSRRRLEFHGEVLTPHHGWDTFLRITPVVLWFGGLAAIRYPDLHGPRSSCAV